MQSFMELTLIKDSEISPYFIWSRVYTQLHLAFVEQKDPDEQITFGVSFPEYKAAEVKDKKIITLGSKLRVFANTMEDLQRLNLEKWLERLTDYVHIKSAKQVPDSIGQVCVSRYRPQPNLEYLARRYAKKHKNSGVRIEDAIRRLQGYQQTFENYPYIQLKSLENGHRFTLCIKQVAVEQPVQGKFSTYGLSSTTTVPHW